MLRFFRKHFITGLVFLAPVVITAYIIWKIFISVDNLIEPLRSRYPIIDIPGLGVIAVFIIIVLAGFLAGNLLGRRLTSLLERYMNHIPLIRGIYMAVKEIGQVFLADKRTVFRRVVLVRFPNPYTYAIAFVTNERHMRIEELAEEDLVSVFLPTTPNPTSGFMLLLSRKDVVPLAISVEEGLKMVISGGAVSPAAFSIDKS